MTDRPSSPGSADQPRPGEETTALPHGDPAATAPLPPRPPTAPAGAPARSGPRRWWDDATSTGAGRGALVAVAVLASLLLLTGVGLTAAFVARHVGPGRGDMGWSANDGAPGMGPGRGNGSGRNQGRNGNGMMGDDEDGLAQGPQRKPGKGTGKAGGNGAGLGRGAAMLGAGVLHGEFTTAVTGTPALMVVQTGEVTAYTAEKSLTVRSTDGFEATYALGGSGVQARGGTALATGVQVRVVAAKAGMKVTALVVG